MHHSIVSALIALGLAATARADAFVQYVEQEGCINPPLSCFDGSSGPGGKGGVFADDDFTYASQWLHTTPGGWIMPKNLTCPEWTLFGDAQFGGTVMITSKSVNPREAVGASYNDIGNAYDLLASTCKKGHETDPAWEKGGGMLVVSPNATDVFYSSDDWKKAGAHNDGLLIKIVYNANAATTTPAS
jgi:hypothetical protein